MDRIISMSAKELKKIQIIGELSKGTSPMTRKEAGEALGVSDRQIRRYLDIYHKKGAEGLLSNKRGKPSNHRLASHLADTVEALIRHYYPDFKPTFIHEKLAEFHNLNISISSIRRIMITKGLLDPKNRKKAHIHQLRPRRAQEGELTQMDGSPHDWFEGRGPRCTLLCCVDDATSKMLSGFFCKSEDMWGYFRMLRDYFQRHGRPNTFYLDKHGVFRVNAKEALTGEGITQFGRAMKELGIHMIFANSPQAKGRVERANRTLQDRLVKELRLRKISTIEDANTFLPEFIENYNRRFAVVPQSPLNAHKPLQPEHDLDRIFTIQSTRILSKNLTFQYNNKICQIYTKRPSYAMRKARVQIREKEDGSLLVFYKGTLLKFSIYAHQEKPGEVVDSKRLNEVIDDLQQRIREIESIAKDPPALVQSSTGKMTNLIVQGKRERKPGKNHPWRSRIL